MKKSKILNFIESELNYSNGENIGIFNGIASECVFYYLYGRLLDEPKFTEIADNRIDKVFETMSNASIDLEFRNGLTGIGWVIEHLVQLEFLEGDTNEILEVIDDQLYKYLSFKSEVLFNGKIEDLLGYGFYAIKRLSNKKNKKNLELKRILEEMLVMIINRISEVLDEYNNVVSEPINYKSTWSLPILLAFLANLLHLNIYTYKVENIVKHQLFSQLLSFVPRTNINRYFLLLAVNHLNIQMEYQELKDFIGVLQSNLDYEKILNYDFREMDIMIMDGSAGLFLLTQYLFNDGILSNELLFKINNSSYWKILEDDRRTSYIDKSFGNGLCGLGIVLLSVELRKKKK